jgi:hypothetical protein
MTVWRTLTFAADEIGVNGSAIDATIARTAKYNSALFNSLLSCESIFKLWLLEEAVVYSRAVISDNRVGGGVTSAVLPHHRTYGSVYGGS